jgi:outer membrane protein assembly factor BamB
VFTRPSATDIALLHWRNGVSIGQDGTVYVSASWRLSALAVSAISGVAAMNPDGDVIWTYGVDQSVTIDQSYFGTPTIGQNGLMYVVRTNRLQALQ